MYKVVLFLVLGLVLISGQHCTHRESDGALGQNIKPLYPALSKEIIKYVNDITNATWVAKDTNVFHSVNDIKSRLGVVEDPNRFRLPKMCKLLTDEMKAAIPESFDARKKWDKCPSLGKVDDHGECASSWAFAAVNSINDRLCVMDKGAGKLSVLDVVSCCGALCGSGCGGGIPSAAWDFWVYNGIVPSDGCKPYPFEKRMNKTTKAQTCNDVKTPKCSSNCENGLVYEDVKQYGQRAYTLQSDELQIQDEIVKYGSVQAEFDVYADFPTYKSGVYAHVAGHKLGKHAVRIIGWGVENGQKYWLCINNWNTQWGEEGSFKILRGVNECNIEMTVNSGIPK